MIDIPDWIQQGYLAICGLILVDRLIRMVAEATRPQPDDFKLGYAYKSPLTWILVFLIACPVVNLISGAVVLYLKLRSWFVIDYWNGLENIHSRKIKVIDNRKNPEVKWPRLFQVTGCSCGATISAYPPRITNIARGGQVGIEVMCTACGKFEFAKDIESAVDLYNGDREYEALEKLRLYPKYSIKRYLRIRGAKPLPVISNVLANPS